MTLSWYLTRLLCSATLAVMLVLAGAPARADHPQPGGAKTSLTQYKIDVWQTEQGLPLNTVQSLFQTRDGYLWVGTAGGIARFDGVRFTTFDSTRAPEMASQPIFGFMEDAQGRLWVGHTKGAAVYSDGIFKTSISAEVTNGRRVWSFAQASDGAVWAATENGLVRWDKGVTKLYQQPHGLPTNRLRSLAFDTEGTLWIGTSGGGLVSFAAEKFQVHNPGNGFPHLEVRAVLADPAGGVWAARPPPAVAAQTPRKHQDFYGGRRTTHRPTHQPCTRRAGLAVDRHLGLRREPFERRALHLHLNGGRLNRRTHLVATD